ncbi:MAG: deoxyribonuclease V [Candidatus Bathyarchaeia archaeon]|nr:deoxyribonuclease V [Candidatus Bathyarchaeota archaeon]
MCVSFSLEKARKIQEILSKKVIAQDSFITPINYIAGVDVAYADKYSIGAVAVLDYASMKPVESRLAVVETRFPYIPTLLSFRELPPAVSAIRKLTLKPSVFLVDGQGIAHPYHFGFASHLGVTLDMATIGVAKSLLCGDISNLGDLLWEPIIYSGKVVGGAVFTKQGSKPIFVSIGHKISLETAIKIVLECSRGHRIPEPLREAHMAAEKTKREILARMK